MKSFAKHIVMKAGFLLLALCLCSFQYAQPPDTLWTRTYGGAHDDAGSSVIKTVDNGYLVTGTTASFGAGDRDIYVVKTDSMGNTQWTKTYGGTGLEIGTSAQQTLDYGFIITGWTESFGAGSCDIYVVRIDSLGDTLWTRTYGGANAEYGNCVQHADDGLYVIVGSTYSFGAGGSDVYLLMIDDSGNVIWAKTYGGTENDVGRSVQQTFDRGYILVGDTRSFGTGDGDVWLVKTDTLGDTLWTRTYGYGWPTSMDGYSVTQTSDTGYVIAGTALRTVGSSWVFCIKTDSQGDSLWTRIYSPGVYDRGNYVIETADGCYVVVGSTSAPVESYIYLIKINPAGDSLWSATYGVGGETGSAIQQTSDQGYIISGKTRTFGQGGSDVWLVKLAPEPGVLEQTKESYRRGYTHATIISGPLQLPPDKKYEIYDIMGRAVDIHRLTHGIYFIEIDGKVTEKVIKIR